MCYILSQTKFAIFRPLDLEDQITYCYLNILIYIEENPGELMSARRILAVVINLYFFSIYILEYNLFSLVECNIKLLITKFDTSLAQKDIADL